MEKGILLNSDYFHARVVEVSQKASVEFTKKVMEQQGIKTCFMHRCLIRAPLRRLDEGYICEPHYQILTREKNRKLSGVQS